MLFLIDGVGAAVSTFFLGVVLVDWNDIIGMPIPVLYVLATIALIFSIHSFASYFLIKADGHKTLKIVALLNILYCILTMVLVAVHYKNISLIGIGYFVIEVLIILALAKVEITTSIQKSKNHG